jgi:hypothetical protein
MRILCIRNSGSEAYSLCIVYVCILVYDLPRFVCVYECREQFIFIYACVCICSWFVRICVCIYK